MAWHRTGTWHSGLLGLPLVIAAPGVAQAADDPFQSAPGPEAPKPPPRPHVPLPPSEGEPVAPGPVAPAAPNMAPGPPSEPGRAGQFDGVWTGNRSCAAFGNRQAFTTRTLIFEIKNSHVSLISRAAAGTPGYATIEETLDQAGNVTLVGEGISNGAPGGAPRGTQVRYRYEGRFEAERFTANDIMSLPRECHLELTRHR